MDALPINITDIAVFAILLISAVLALSHGFVKEVLAIAGWVGAAVVALKLFPVLQPVTRQYVEHELLADGITGAGIFLVTLVLLSLVAGRIARLVRDSEINTLDRSLGFLFGLARGAVIVALGYLVLVQFVPPREFPAWLGEARSLPVVAYTADLLLTLAPEEIAAGLRVVEDVGDSATKALRPQDALGVLQGAVTAPDSGDEKGYKSEDRRGLERLFESKQDN